MDNIFDRLKQRMEMRANKTILNPNNVISDIEKKLADLKIRIDRFHEHPSFVLKEDIEKIKFQIESQLELFQEDSVHPDKMNYDKYKMILEKFLGEI